MAFPRSQRAFTLLEVVLALAITAVGLVGILSVFPVALINARDSKTETRLALIAQTIFSDLRARDSIETLPGKFTPDFLISHQTITNYYSGDGRPALAAQGVFSVTIESIPDPALLPTGYQVIATFYPGNKKTSSPIATFTVLLPAP